MRGSGVQVMMLLEGVRVVAGGSYVENCRVVAVCREVAVVVRPVGVCWCNAHTLARGGQLCFAWLAGHQREGRSFQTNARIRLSAKC